MKSILFSVAGVVIFMIATSCMSQKDYVIESDYNYAGRFKKYKTFDFVHVEEKDSSSHNPDLERWMINRLEAQGYTFTTRRPDMYVNYKVYYSTLKYKGYNQEDLKTYLNLSTAQTTKADDLFADETDAAERNVTASHSQEYYSRYYTMDSGMLLIILIDRKQHSAVWQGYASGIFSSGSNNLNRQLRRAAGAIFDKYTVVADGYLMDRQ